MVTEKGKSQTGVAAIGLVALLLAISALLLGSQVLLSSKTEGEQVGDQLDALKQAKSAINAFAFVNGRLPCPSAVPNGGESCGIAKGWLPAGALQTLGVNMQAVQRHPVIYMAYVGAGVGSDPDLTARTGFFQPLSMAQRPVATYPEVLSLPDLCGKLRAIAPPPGGGRTQIGDGFNNSTGRADRANTTFSTAGSRLLNVAYGLATTRPGLPYSADRANATMGQPSVVAPDALQTEEYVEKVQIVLAPELFNRLGCTSMMASLDAIATAGSFTAMGVAAREAALLHTEDNVNMGALFVTASTLNVAETVVDIWASIEVATENEALLALKTPGLPFTLYDVTHHIAGVISGFAALTPANVSLAKNVAGLFNDSWQLAANWIIQQQVKDSTVWTGSVPVLRSADEVMGAPYDQ